MTEADLILGAAGSFGADLAGIASVADLPAHDDVAWPKEARCVVAVAVAHPAARAELDWWFGRVDPPGNRVLSAVVQQLCDWADARLGARPHHLPYHVERGGIYLKDAAVLAGLGCIGLNNLLLTPAHGPRVRLRALTLDLDLPSTGITSFDPCSACDAPCRAACPREAFPPRGRAAAWGQAAPLPGRDGSYARSRCAVQMDADIEAGTEEAASGFDSPIKIIKYCRACEFACPVGA